MSNEAEDEREFQVGLRQARVRIRAAHFSRFKRYGVGFLFAATGMYAIHQTPTLNEISLIRVPAALLFGYFSMTTGMYGILWLAEWLVTLGKQPTLASTTRLMERLAEQEDGSKHRQIR
jgi:hypothetical protein